MVHKPRGAHCFAFERLHPELQLAIVKIVFESFSGEPFSRELKSFSSTSRKVRALTVPYLFRRIVIATFEPNYFAGLPVNDKLSLPKLFRFTRTVHLRLNISHFGNEWVEEESGHSFFHLEAEKLVGLGKAIQSSFEFVLSVPDNQVDSIHISFSESEAEPDSEIDLLPALKLILHPLELKSEIDLSINHSHYQYWNTPEEARRNFSQTFQALPSQLRIRSLKLEAVALCHSDVGVPTDAVIDSLTLSCGTFNPPYIDWPSTHLPPIKELTILTSFTSKVHISQVFAILRVCPSCLEVLSIRGQILSDLATIPQAPSNPPRLLLPLLYLRRLELLEQFGFSRDFVPLDQLMKCFSAGPIQILVLDSQSLHTIALKEQGYEGILRLSQESFGQRLLKTGFFFDGSDGVSNAWALLLHSLLQQRNKGGWSNLSTVCLGTYTRELIARGIVTVDNPRSLLAENGIALRLQGESM
ncbi:hypothetical protein BT69DRAFT_1321707 [Atractiella rhizophila]|nr:hypothetical protein BT69DRAFT_1321707 [Atractiella rhizophila]